MIEVGGIMIDDKGCVVRVEDFIGGLAKYEYLFDPFDETRRHGFTTSYEYFAGRFRESYGIWTWVK